MSEVPVIQLDKQTETPALKIELKASQQGISNLIKALTAARPNFKPIKRSAENPFYKDPATGKPKKYADLSELINATADALAAQGLHIFQFPIINNDQTIGVTTLLAHASGEWIEHTATGCPAIQRTDRGIRFDAQTLGIGITYISRYSYRGVLNLASEEDDDGNGLVSQPAREQPKVFKPKVVDKVVEMTPGKVIKAVEPSPESELSRMDDDGCPLSDEDISSDPLPTPKELQAYTPRLRALKQDSRVLKSWVEKKAGKEWKQITKKQFETIISELEKAGDKVGELIGG